MKTDQTHLLALFDHDQRQNPSLIFEQVEKTPHTTRLIANDWAAVIYSRLDESNADAAIAAEIAHFQALGKNFEWKVFDHDEPADLKSRLLAQGFQAAEAEALTILELAQAPARLGEAISLDIRKITSVDGLEDVQQVQLAVWGNERDLRPYLAQYLRESPDSMSIYVGYDAAGKAAAAAWAVFHPNTPFVSFWGGSTVEGQRGKGFYRQLVALRLQEALARGYQYAYVDASAMSQPILERQGFRTLAYSYPYFFQVSHG